MLRTLLPNICSTLLLGIFLVFVLNLPTVEASSRIVWENNSHSYQRIENALTWPEANTYCELQSGYLATITSKEENDFIFSQFGDPSILLWLGGSDAGNEGTWTWVSDEPWIYSNWEAGEPNNFISENSLMMGDCYGDPCKEWVNKGKWNDQNSDTALWFICEWNSDGQNDRIIMALEEPVNSSIYSGISNVRGWAVAPQGLQKIEMYVDGALQGNIPLGGRRSDVGTAYPGYPGSADSGFAMAYNYSNLTAGPHTLTTRAYDASGGARDASAAFTVARFAEAFMADPAAINLDQATLARAGNTITIQKLLAAGQPYNVQLTWHPAAQGFALTQIEGSMNSCRATLSQSILNVPASGGTGNISVSIPSDCPWTANSDVPWVIITSGASGVGSGDVAFTVSENLSNVLRSGTLTIASQAVTLRQESGDPGGGGQ